MIPWPSNWLSIGLISALSVLIAGSALATRAIDRNEVVDSGSLQIHLVRAAH